MSEARDFVVRSLGGEALGIISCPAGSTIKDLKRQVAAAIGTTRFQIKLVSGLCLAGQDSAAATTLQREVTFVRKALADSDQSTLHRAVVNRDLIAMEACLQLPILPRGPVLQAALEHDRNAPINSIRGLDTATNVLPLLLEARADPNCTDKSDNTALATTVELGIDRATEVLLAAGADPNCLIGPVRRRTHLLHHAADTGNMMLVESLLRARAAVDYVDFSSRTPLEVAVTQNHRAVAGCLLRAGAKAEPPAIRNRGQLFGLLIRSGAVKRCCMIFVADCSQGRIPMLSRILFASAVLTGVPAIVCYAVEWKKSMLRL